MALVGSSNSDSLSKHTRQAGVADQYQRPAVVEYPDGNRETFFVHKNADGQVLLDLATSFVLLTTRTKSYFALTFPDKKSKKPRFLYNDRPIAKQIDADHWKFTLAFKFYLAEPAEIPDGLTRHFLVHQCRRDIYNRRIPTDPETQAQLASYIAQSELGDFQHLANYADYVRAGKFSTSVDLEFITLIQEYHQLRRGKSGQQAELNYLNFCRNLPLYGFHTTTTKETHNGVPIDIGCGAKGIVSYEATKGIIDCFDWIDIDKISFRRKYFCVRFLSVLQSGVRNERGGKSVVYKLPTSTIAERFYKLAVEHHEFFRLMKPNPKVKSASSFFRWASRRFGNRCPSKEMLPSVTSDGRQFDFNETVRTFALDETIDEADMTVNMSMLDRTHISGDGSVYSIHDLTPPAEGDEEALHDCEMKPDENESENYILVASHDDRKLVKVHHSNDGKLSNESYQLICESEAANDHDAELSRAIQDATKLNPNLVVERFDGDVEPES